MVLCLLWNAIAVHLILNDSEVSPRHPPPPHTATSVASSAPCEGSFPSSLPLASSQWPHFHSRFAPNSSDIFETLIKTRLRNDSFFCRAVLCDVILQCRVIPRSAAMDACEFWQFYFSCNNCTHCHYCKSKASSSHVGAQLVVFLNWLAVNAKKNCLHFSKICLFKISQNTILCEHKNFFTT